MRLAMLENLGGYQALKDEVMEDVRLAEMIKRFGGSMVASYAPGLLRTRMYTNFAEMWESCTKTWFSAMKFSLPFAALCAFWMYFMALISPLVTLASGVGMALGFDHSLWRWFVPAILAWLIQVAVFMIASLNSGVPPAYAFTAPLGLTLLYTMLLDSGIRITIGKGVTWKGRMIYERDGVAPPDLAALTARVSRMEK